MVSQIRAVRVREEAIMYDVQRVFISFYRQSGDTWISGIPPDLGEKHLLNLGESPRPGGINFVQCTKVSKMEKIGVL